MRILLIEDDILLIYYYKDVLGNIGGHKIEAVDWLQKAVAYLKEVEEGKKEKPDLILLDVIMPDKEISAMDVLKLIKSKPKLKDIPVWIFTNYGKEEMYGDYIQAGAERVIIKARYGLKDLLNLFSQFKKLD